MDSAYRLPQEIARKVWKAVSLLSRNPNSPGLNLERLRGKPNGLWSFRIDQQYRGILHRNESVTTFLFVGKEEDAYRFAERVPKIATPAGSQPSVGTRVSDFENPGAVAAPTPKQPQIAKTAKYPSARTIFAQRSESTFCNTDFRRRGTHFGR